MSTDLKPSKPQISKIIQSGGFLGSLFSNLAGPLMKVAIPLAKNVLAPLGITAPASAIDAEIQKNSWFWNNNFNYFKVRALEDSNILPKGVTKTIKNETKEQNGGFLDMLLGTLGASLLGNLLAGKGIVRAGSDNKKGKGIVRAGSGNKKGKGIELALKKIGIFNASSSFNKLWNTKVLSKWIKI